MKRPSDKSNAMFVAQAIILHFEGSGELVMVDTDAGADSCFDVLLDWGTKKERRLTVQVHETTERYVSSRRSKPSAKGAGRG